MKFIVRFLLVMSAGITTRVWGAVEVDVAHASFANTGNCVFDLTESNRNFSTRKLSGFYTSSILAAGLAQKTTRLTPTWSYLAVTNNPETGVASIAIQMERFHGTINGVHMSSDYLTDKFEVSNGMALASNMNLMNSHFGRTAVYSPDPGENLGWLKLEKFNESVGVDPVSGATVKYKDTITLRIRTSPDMTEFGEAQYRHERRQAGSSEPQILADVKIIGWSDYDFPRSAPTPL